MKTGGFWNAIIVMKVYYDWLSNTWYCLISRQPGMAVRMPTPINQVFNDESIAVQIIFLDDYTWN